MEVMRILSAQIAISIENASLYASLEEKVAARTDELRRAQARVVSLEKDQTERQMAGGFAHEMRNALVGSKMVLDQALGRIDGACESVPLASAKLLERLYKELKGMVGEGDLARLKPLLSEIVANEEFLEEALQIAHQSASRGLSITQGILDYAKTGQEGTNPEPVDLNHVVRSAGAQLERELASEGIRLEVSLDEGAGTVHSKKAHILSVVCNLLLNARDAVNDSTRTPREKLIRVETGRSNGRTRLSVMDNGIGIPPENRARIFEPFFSTKPDTGTGLGLALVRKIVLMANAEISVDSAVGEGTTFEVTFP
jgi:signal transduction histidine kinase